MVPTSVTTSGLMPSLMKRLTKGASMTPCQNCLNLSSTAAGYPCSEPPSQTSATAVGTPATCQSTPAARTTRDSDRRRRG